jgi:hypothetical protein
VVSTEVDINSPDRDLTRVFSINRIVRGLPAGKIGSIRAVAGSLSSRDDDLVLTLAQIKCRYTLAPLSAEEASVGFSPGCCNRKYIVSSI